jgi:8-oxo-dGTP pyrophosphatase MutT (NUDIX family)
MNQDHHPAPTSSKSDGSASLPIPAATVLLLRDGAAGLEVFMVIRNHQIDFASGALVFPGGKLDPQDTDPRVLARLSAAATSALDATQAPLRAAAIREVFEESGIFLARRADASALLPDLVTASWQQGLNAQQLSMADIIESGNLTLAGDQLVHFSHWITPPMMPKRFDTHFYLARVPAGQVAHHDGEENVGSVWITPRQAIMDASNLTRTIIFPTLSNLVRLARHGSVEEAFEAARNARVTPITPWTEQRDDGRYVCIPKNLGFDLSEQKLPARSGKLA